METESRIAEWEKAGEQLKGDLVRERESLLAKLTKVEAALRRLGWTRPRPTAADAANGDPSVRERILALFKPGVELTKPKICAALPDVAAKVVDYHLRKIEEGDYSVERVGRGTYAMSEIGGKAAAEDEEAEEEPRAKTWGDEAASSLAGEAQTVQLLWGRLSHSGWSATKAQVEDFVRRHVKAGNVRLVAGTNPPQYRAVKAFAPGEVAP